MNPIPLDIAVEDELSELVASRLVRESTQKYHVSVVHGRGGYGYLKTTIQGWNRASRGRPMLVLTDLDAASCAATLQRNWLGRQTLEPNLLFRVAVREVEAWLLADWDSLLSFLQIPGKKARHLTAPESTETLADPKADLVRLASFSSSRETRVQLVPRSGSTAKQGPEYTQCLSAFVEGPWDSSRAVHRNKSLERTILRLNTFRPYLPTT